MPWTRRRSAPLIQVMSAAGLEDADTHVMFINCPALGLAGHVVILTDAGGTDGEGNNSKHNLKEVMLLWQQIKNEGKLTKLQHCSLI